MKNVSLKDETIHCITFKNVINVCCLRYGGYSGMMFCFCMFAHLNFIATIDSFNLAINTDRDPFHDDFILRLIILGV